MHGFALEKSPFFGWYLRRSYRCLFDPKWGVPPKSCSKITPTRPMRRWSKIGAKTTMIWTFYQCYVFEPLRKCVFFTFYDIYTWFCAREEPILWMISAQILSVSFLTPKWGVLGSISENFHFTLKNTIQEWALLRSKIMHRYRKTWKKYTFSRVQTHKIDKKSIS